MNRIPPILLVLVLLLAPIFAALPDGSTLTQPLWASILCVLVMIAVIVTSTRKPVLPGRVRNKAILSFAVLLALALLSIPARILTHHSTAYLGLMLRGGAVLAAEFALFLLCRSLARAGRTAVYTLTGAATTGAVILATNGVTEYALHALAGDTSWRVFSWSTPDFLAGYLVLLLPISLALFLGAPFEKRLPLLFGLFIVVQMATLLLSGSRFALVSLLVAVLVFAGTFGYAARHGLTPDAGVRRRIIGIVIVVALAGIVAIRPVLRRLHSTSEGNSGAFRVWTWKGAVHMAAANPVLGTGVGTWIDTYPPYALTGFTRLAHNSYLQIADECGIPALLALVVTLSFVGVVGVRGLRTPLGKAASETAPLPLPGPPRKKNRQPLPAVAATDTDFLSGIASSDDRLLLCGLLASLAGGIVQNLIDSDWHVFFIGITFWATAGLVVGLAERGDTENAPRPGTRRLSFAITGAATILLALFATEGIAAWFGYRAQIAADPASSQANYALAQTWDPLDGRYPAELGARVYGRTDDLTAGIASLRLAVRLEPNGTNYNRLGILLDKDGKPGEAAAAYQSGLQIDPNSLDLLLALAKDSPPEQALSLYRRIVALEDSPVGQVRAIGEITEVRFAIADAAIAGAATAAGNSAEAIQYDQRAQRLLEAYVTEGGTTNGERQVQMGNHPDPMEDTQYRNLYAQVMQNLIAAAPADQKPALRASAEDYRLRFQGVIAAANATLGDLTAPSPDARGDYEAAATLLESYPDEAEASGQRSDPKQDTAMRRLYKHVMDSLTALTPANEKAAIQDREQRSLQKFDRLFPTH